MKTQAEHRYYKLLGAPGLTTRSKEATGRLLASLLGAF